MVVKKLLKVLGKIGIYLLTTLFAIVITLSLTCLLFCKGPSKSAKELFVTTFLETGQMKFVIPLFLSDNEIKDIVNQNSLTEMQNDVNSSLINVNKEIKKDIVIEEVSGSNYSGTMMIISDPSKVFVGTTYPWSEYGKSLDEIVKLHDAVGGINGGLYVSTANKGGYPLGVVVSKGEMQNISATGYAGLHLIGLDEDNILKIVNLENKNTDEIKKIIKEEKIRDAVSFQDEASDKNNHFVKLIINGEARKLNGLGSGANPRTVIGQKKDGTILLFVTDGRGVNGHLGATAADLIEVMQKYDAFNAANLDGGSSSTMYYNNKYLRTSVTLYYVNSSWRIPTAFLVKGGK